MKYYNFHNVRNETNQLPRWKIFVRSVLIALLIVGIALLYVFIDIRKKEAAKVGKVLTAANDSYQNFETDYFSFRASKNWIYVAEESKDKVYIYKKMQGGLYTAIFSVNIDQPIIPEDRRALYVVPFAQEKDSYKLSKQNISPACNEMLKEPEKYPVTKTENVNFSPILYQDVSFACWGTNYQPIVIAAIAGGDDLMKLRRPIGIESVYRLEYKDVRNSSLQFGADSLMFESFEVK